MEVCVWREMRQRERRRENVDGGEGTEEGESNI